MPPSSPRRRLCPVVPDRIDLRDRLYLPRLTSAPPQSLNTLESTPLPILDQGQTNACTGFALSNVVNFLMIRAGRASETPVAPFMLYSMARRYDEFSGSSAEDTGSSLRGAMKGWYKHGVCRQRLWTAPTMPRPKPDPSKDWWQDAARRPLGAYYRVDTRSVSDMQAALHDVGILYASAICHAGWDEGLKAPETPEGGIWRIPICKPEPAAGGHAFCLVGYSREGFLLLNSWSATWGTGGLAILRYEDWLDNAMDCWVSQLGVVTEQHEAIAQAPSLRIGPTGRVTLASDEVLRNREIAPFVVDMENNGSLSQTGEFRTQVSDLEALLTNHLAEARTAWSLDADAVVDVAIYAHGGLTGESAAARTASRWIPALYDDRIFPIFLMWETSLFDTLKNRLEDTLRDVVRPAGGWWEQIRDEAQRRWDARLEKALAEAGSLIWGEMKQNADAISKNRQGGGQELYRVNARVKALRPDRARIHLVGHSAGAIVLSLLASRLAAAGWRFESIVFLAPAVTVSTFDATVLPLINSGKVRHYHQFHLSDNAESKDPTCRPILGYGRSLLYLVSESFEHGVRTAILGMEKYAVPWTARQGLERIKMWTAPGRGSGSATHGGFDDDEETLNTVVQLLRPAAATGRAARRRRPVRRAR